MVNLSQIFVYPVKSMRGLQLSHAQIIPGGLTFDRIFMLTDCHGKFITARQYPQLVRFTPSLTLEGMVITAPDNQSITVKLADFSPAMQPTEVWGNQFTAHTALESINEWLSARLNQPVQLRWVGPELTRRIRRFPEIPLSFADAYPFLLINQSSFDALQQRCPATLELPQFRPNFVVNGVPAFAEDSWKTIRIGEIIFDVAKPCSRCILTTVNVKTGKPHSLGEPLTTLQQFRTAENGDIDFGINLIARNQGVIRVNDPLEILATQPGRAYIEKHIEKQPSEQTDAAEEPLKTVVIEYEGAVFTGNNRQVLLEQLEQQGIPIDYSCRAGICGCCRIALDSGEVSPLRQGAVKNNGTILACSCIPKSNIRLSSLK